jgi:dephospho-CoA kinase
MILVFVDSKKFNILKRLNKRKGFNQKVFQKLKKMQLPLDYKKRKSHYVINNNNNKSSTRKRVKDILNMIRL